MGKIQILTRKQKLILDQISQDSTLTSLFCFTGGTALSQFYLQHRYSIDLDFFSQKEFEAELLMSRLNQWSKKHKFIYTSRFVDPTYIIQLRFKDGDRLKVDFAHHPYKHLQPTVRFLTDLQVESKYDIAVNKMMALTRRADAKDYVDIYFLLREYTFWDLRDGILAKFNMELEPMLISADFLSVESIDTLPKMIKPLTLDELKSFFRQKAKELAKTAVE